MNFKTLRKYS